MTRAHTLVCIVAVLALTWGCGTPTPPDTREADERAIREIETKWSQVVAAKDLEGHVAFYADDASVFLPNAPAVSGKDAIRAALKPLYAAPGFSMSFQTAKVEVSRGGDLAYSHGTYAMTMNDPKGKPVTDKGKYVTVYKKQADGAWKAVADIFNTDLPAPAPPAK